MVCKPVVVICSFRTPTIASTLQHLERTTYIANDAHFTNITTYGVFAMPTLKGAS